MLNYPPIILFAIIPCHSLSRSFYSCHIGTSFSYHRTSATPFCLLKSWNSGISSFVEGDDFVLLVSINFVASIVACEELLFLSKHDVKQKLPKRFKARGVKCTIYSSTSNLNRSYQFPLYKRGRPNKAPNFNNIPTTNYK